jgi:hypothetical protein
MPARKQAKARSSGKAEKPNPAWRRAEAGSYRSADDRFSVDSEGSGRWFVRDAEQPDDFGQPRTTGPFATLDEAKAAAEAQRGNAPEASPLQKRLTETSGGRGRSGSRRGGSRAPTKDRDAATPPRRQTWLDRLEDRDRVLARRARALVRALDDAGIADAEEVVRRDVEGRRPAVTEAALSKALRDAVAAALDPDALVAAARRRIPGLEDDTDDLSAYAAFVASRVVEAMLGQISVGERGTHRDQTLPGWQLIEDAGEERRLVVTASDVLGKR